MDRVMKRIVSFLILASLYAVILMLPATETPAAVPHPVPMWSILCYVTVVAAAGVIVFLKSRRIEEKETATV